MEIHYFWIENFNNIIKGQPITLSSRYIFTTEIDNRTKTGKITIIDNPEFIENFFDKPNIKNISVIVGKNGAGKTSIFNYILETFPEGRSEIIQKNALVVYNQQDSNELCIVKSECWKVEILNKTNQKHNIKEYKDLKNSNFISDLNAIHFFYYNFFLDYYKTEVRNWAGIKNLSTSTLLCLPRKKAIEERWRDKIDPTEAKIFDLDFFIKDEISKAIQLLISDKKALIPFSTPEELYITISTNDYKYFRDTTTKKDCEINSIVSLLLEKFKQINDATKN
jgi:predicted GTPase